MRITSRGVNLYGFIAIALMLVMVGVVFFRVVPRSWHFPLFAVALTLFMIRIALRLVLARQKRLEDEERSKAREGDGGAGAGNDANATHN
jgi:uncharacterized membrane protein YfcA